MTVRPPGPLFAIFSADEFAAVPLMCDRRAYAPGDVLVELGDPAPGLHILLDGEVTIERPDASGAGVVYDVSQRGDIIGEASLFDRRPAMATVRARTAVESLRVSAPAYRALCERNDPLAHVIERVALVTLAKRLRRLDAMVIAKAPGRKAPWTAPASQGVLDRILGWFQRGPSDATAAPIIERHPTEILYSCRMFKDVPFEVRDELAARLVRETAPKGTFLCVQGELSDRMYLLGSGAVEVFVSLDDSGRRVHDVGPIQPGELFGITAMIDGRTRLASCVVTETAQVLRLDRGEFYAFVNERTPAGRAVRRAVLVAFASQLASAAANVVALAGESDLMALAGSLERA